MDADIKWHNRICENRYFVISSDTTVLVKIFFVASLRLLFQPPSFSQQDYSILDNKLLWDRNLGFNIYENINF